MLFRQSRGYFTSVTSEMCASAANSCLCASQLCVCDEKCVLGRQIAAMQRKSCCWLQNQLEIARRAAKCKSISRKIVSIASNSHTEGPKTAFLKKKKKDVIPRKALKPRG